MSSKDNADLLLRAAQQAGITEPKELANSALTQRPQVTTTLRPSPRGMASTPR